MTEYSEYTTDPTYQAMLDRDKRNRQCWDQDDVLVASDFSSRGWPTFWKNGHGEVYAVAENVMLFDHLPGIEGIAVRISYNTVESHLQIRLGEGEASSSNIYFSGYVKGLQEADWEIVKALAEQLHNRVFLGGNKKEIEANPWAGCQCKGQGLVDSVDGKTRYCSMCQGFSLEDWPE
jgi:hypothetical protein